MQTYFRIIRFGKPYFWWGGLALICILVYTIFSAVSLVSIIPFLEILFGQADIGAPSMPFSWLDIAAVKAHGYYFLSQQIAATDKMQVLLYFCITVCVMIVVKNLARYGSSFCMAPLEFGIIRNMRNQMFGHMSSLDLNYFTKNRKGDLISRQVSDVQTVTFAIVSNLQMIVREPLTVFVFFFTLLFISWKLTLFTLLILPLTAILINLIAKPLKRDTRRGQEVLGDLLGILDEFISGIRIVRAFQKEEYERGKYQQQNDEYTRLQVSIRRKVELASPVTEIISVGIVCIIIFYGGSLILEANSQFKASEFIGFIAVFTQFLSPIKVISNAISKIQKGIAAFERIDDMLQEKVSIQSPPHAKAKTTFTDHIRFEKVGFRYDADGPEVLKDIDFSLKKGQTVALVGPSGGGKSTLADLLPRFYDPTAGQILLDGTDIRQMRLEDLRAQIGIVSQEGILFHDSVLHNIAYGIEALDRGAVIEAAKVANAHEFISELPEGYDTLIGERGTRLSGGQRQRIAIARAVLRNPAILILDEATSSLDTQSEKSVQNALTQLMQNRTTLVIAHRLSTIQNADLILAIEMGQIAERGSHQELLAQNGLYKKLHSLQA
ncbi:MAG: ABC transporter ATP-binding protein [Bacteroidota bacterium]